MTQEQGPHPVLSVHVMGCVRLCFVYMGGQTWMGLHVVMSMCLCLCISGHTSGCLSVWPSYVKSTRVFLSMYACLHRQVWDVCEYSLL